jgi:anti-anti-sigma factor
MTAEQDKTVAAPEQLGVDERESFRDRAFQTLDAMQEGEGSLVVDLSETYFVDTAGLGVLADVQRRAAQRKHAVRLKGVNEDIRFTLVLSRMEDLFVIESNGNGRQNGH